MFRPIYTLALMLLFVLAACATAPTATPLPAPTLLPTTLPPTNPPVVMTSAPPTAIAPTIAAPTRAKTVTPVPTPTVMHPDVLTLEPAPVLEHSKPGIFPMQYIDPGAMVEQDGKLYMFFNGINGWPAPVGIGLATSTDGKTWTREGIDAVFKTEGLPYVGFTSFASSALVEDDGTWVLYFYALDETNFEKGSIGRATAKSPLGPWTADAEPVLKPGDAGAWDSYQVTQPSVVKTADGYVMYFAGGDKKNGARRIGMATSTDGIHWEKYRDPKTTDAMYAASSPVFDLNTAGTWDDTRIFDANVVKNADGWTMTYLADKIQFANVGLGVATSDDGIHWTRQYNSLVLAPTDIKDGKATFLSNMIYHDGSYLVYFDVGRGRRGTDVFMARRDGSFRPQ